MGRLLRRALLRGAAHAAGAVALGACIPPASAPSSSPAGSPGTSSRVIGSNASPLPVPSVERLPRWRGFNLNERAPHRENKPLPYEQWDFDFMAEQGFNFVRLAEDPRRWTTIPGQINEAGIAETERAMGWARERRIHVNLDMHAVPGYTEYTRPRVATLWEDGPAGDEFRRQFTEIWRALAKRYRGIPSAELSFDLINEPYDGVTPAAYVRAAEPVVAAIRAEDPSRLIVADGTKWARIPVAELTRLKVAQSTHMYQPIQLTHYKAGWVQGSDKWPVPTWPLQPAANVFIAGPFHKDFQSALILRGDFPAASEVRITVDTVSKTADLVVRADAKEILRKQFAPGPGSGEWKISTFRPQYNLYEGTYDRPYVAAVPAAAREISFEVAAGDWLTFSEIRVRRPGAAEVVLLPGSRNFGVRQSTYTIDAAGLATPTSGHATDKEDLWQTEIAPWKGFADGGVGVHVGEFGAYNMTPHDVVLRWMTDVLELFRRAGSGWALWNLRGPFGPMDSERSDVRYEDYKGHRLDRAMLELLRAG